MESLWGDGKETGMRVSHVQREREKRGTETETETESMAPTRQRV